MRQLFLFLLGIWVTQADAQIDGLLSEDSHFSDELVSGESHEYSVDLTEGTLLLFVVQQKGIDLKVTAHTPDGEPAGEFDSPNGTHGPEVVRIVGEQSGTYRFVVEPLNEDGDGEGEQGDYDLDVLRIEPVASTVEGRIDQIFAAWDRNGVPGASVAVLEEGKLMFSKGYGEANLEYGVKNGAETIFHVASVSKQFTAFAIAMLAQQGKIDLDADIRTYLPEMPEFDHVITVRHLVHHTSGLRDQWNLLVMAGWRFDDVITSSQIEKLLLNQKELNFTPGDEYLYCNSGYFLMARIVEEISGQTFAEWTTENIFKPLEMHRTFFYDDHEKIVPNRAYSYHNAPGGYAKSVLSYANVGATSLFTTAEDLCKWSANFYDIRVGNAQLMEQMHERGVLNGGDTISYAFGQLITSQNGIPVVSHGGADAGYRTYLARLSEEPTAIVVLSNLASFNPGAHALQIAEVILEDKIQSQEAEEEEGAKSIPIESEETVKLSEELLNEYSGRYELAPSFILTVTVEDGILHLQATGQSKLAAEARSETQFFIPDATGTATIEFLRNDEGEIDRLTLVQAGGEHSATKLANFDPADVELELYTGTYYSQELQTAYELVIEDDKLVARHARHEDMTLTPTKPNEFSGDVWYFRQIAMESQDGHVTGFRVTNGRVRKLYFAKVE